MKIRILRRRGLGNTSTKAIKQYSNNDIEIIRNDAIIPEDTDLLIRWGTRSHFPSKKTLNKSQAISDVNNKYTSRKKLQEVGISVPKLVTYGDDVNFPVIVRPEFHSQGKVLYFCNSRNEIQEAINELISKEKGSYVSEYIKKDQEFGVFIFNNRVTSVIEKKPKSEEAKNTIAWNVAQGTHKFENVRWSNWPINVCIEALKAFKEFNLDFGRVDVIVKDDISYILEINSAHSLTSEYRQRIFAKCVDYYVENGSVVNDINFEEIVSYKSIIHPVLRINKLGKNL